MSRKIGSRERALREQREAVVSATEAGPLEIAEGRVTRALAAGRAAFREIGEALKEIRDGRLYKATHSSFDDYCRERWGFSRIHAHRMIEGADILDGLLPTGNTLPDKVPAERTVRPLAKLPPEERADAYREAVDRSNGKPTAKAVEEVVGERLNGSRPEGPPEARVDPVAEWERAERELEVARHTIRSMSEDDAKREVATWADKYGRLEGRLRQESRTREEAERTARYAQGKLREVREALGVEADREIIPAIRDLLR